MSQPAPQGTAPGEGEKNETLLARLKSAWELEFASLRWRVLLCTLLARLLPAGRAFSARAALIRAMGVSIGARTRFTGLSKLQSSPPGPLNHRLKIGADCMIGADVILEFGEVLTIGDRTSLADGVVILTTTHQLGPREHRAGPIVRSPVAIGNDVEIGVNAIVLPGATIGDGARIMPNSVVNTNVQPGVTVGGIPARPLRSS
jgi:maltose O-acetyltransferase